MGKVRRVDFFPDEFLSGVDGMSPEQVGVYWLVCSKIYSRGGGIPDDDTGNARVFRLDPRTWKRIKGELIAKGKLNVEGDALVNRRCTAELAKARKRIDDAHRNGAEGGRPLGTPAEDPVEDLQSVHPTVQQAFTQPSANCSQTVDDKSQPDVSENNDLTKAAGFSGENLTTNHQPATTKEEELVPPIDEGKYAFAGKIVHLTPADFQKWEKTFHAIPDLRAELANYDAWFSDAVTDEKERKKWFHRTRQRMNAIHQRLTALRQNGGGQNLNESF